MKALIIARREWRSAIETPVAYLVLALLPALTAAFFFVVGSFFAERVPDLRGFFGLMPPLMILVAPALTMRLWAEEARTGTEELLLSYPFRVRDLVLGKFLGAWGLLAVSLLFTLGVPATVAALGPLDWGPVLGAYLGTLLLGAACCAAGLLFSVLARNQVVAWLLGVVALLFLNLLALAATASSMPAGLARLLLRLDLGRRFLSVTRGVLSLDDGLYFLALTLFFLCLSGLVLQQRRWR